MALVLSAVLRDAWSTVADAAGWVGVKPELWSTELASIPGSGAPRIKLAQVIDQAKDVEVPMLLAEEMTEYRNTYTVAFGDNPMENAEATDSQFTALQHIVANCLPPYTDVGVWGPYGTRVERRMRFKARVLDATGNWTQHERPGLDCIESWRKR